MFGEYFGAGRGGLIYEPPINYVPNVLDSLTPQALQPYQGVTPGVDLNFGPRDSVYDNSVRLSALSGIAPTRSAPVYTPSSPIVQSLALAQQESVIDNDARSETISIGRTPIASRVDTPRNLYTPSFGGGGAAANLAPIYGQKSQIDPLILLAALGFGALILLKR